jgi:PAS domain S-box-containing protein
MDSLRLLTSVNAVRKLPNNEAARGIPVKVEGIVTFVNSGNTLIFFQDALSGINLEMLDPGLSLSAGERIELEGMTIAGEAFPLIGVKKVRSLGRSALPPAPPISIDRFFQGESDSLRVELEGIVRAVYGDSNHAILELINGGIRFQATLPNFSNQPLPADLVDHRVKIRGSAGIRFNLQREIGGYQLFTPDLKDVTITEVPPLPPFALPVRPIKDLLRFSSGNSAGHRVHIRGVVLYNKIGEFLYLRDSSGTIYVQTRQEMGILPGTPVDVAGFPAMGETANRLEDAVFQKPLPTQDLPVATITAEQALTGRYHGDLVHIQADLINRVKTSTGVTLVLRTKNLVFDASLDERDADLSGFSEGCQLALTGICLIKSDPGRNPTFQLLLRTSHDIQLLKAAPWFTPTRLFWILGFSGLGIFISFAWGIALRRRVSEQTRIIRRRLEREAALEKEYRDLFENSNDVVFSFDLDGKMTSINKAGEKLVERSRHELTRMSFEEILAPEQVPLVREVIRQLMDGQPPFPFEVEVLAKDGRRSTLEVTAEVLHHEGKPVSLRGIGRDITQRKQAESALRASEERLRQTVKLEAIGTLAGGIAHDFNNILSAILGYAELTLMDKDDPDKVSANLDQIHNAGRRARDLIRQILTSSQKLPYERRPILIQPLLEDAVKLLRATLPTTIEVQVRIAPGCKPVLGDSSQIHQVILNLGTNAFHAMRSTGGRLEFQLQPVLVMQEKPAWQAGLPEGDYNCLTVRDTGHGIEPEILKRIFDPYFTTKPFGDGSGLGLSVVQGIIESYKGVIRVDSQPGQGTVFRIFIPSNDDLIFEPEIQKAGLPQGKECILFIDDEESIVRLMSQTLEKLGHTVITQTNSLSALTLFQQSPQAFTLVITDQTMPHLTGMKLAQKIKALRPELPIILCTGFNEDATPEAAHRIGISAHLYKPVSIHELARTIQQVTGTPPSPQASH